MQVNLYELAEKINEIGGIDELVQMSENNKQLIALTRDLFEQIDILEQEVELYKSLNKAMKLGEYDGI